MSSPISLAGCAEGVGGDSRLMWISPRFKRATRDRIQFIPDTIHTKDPCLHRNFSRERHVSLPFPPTYFCPPLIDPVPCARPGTSPRVCLAIMSSSFVGMT